MSRNTCGAPIGHSTDVDGSGQAEPWWRCGGVAVKVRLDPCPD
jgi:hypothetical protein